MKIIYNSIIPFPGYKAMNLFGVLFARKYFKGKIGIVTINHETIHTYQMKELGYIFFYIWYIIEWLIRLLFTKDRFSHRAYKNISFEQEAYKNQNNLDYLYSRKHYCWLKNL